MRYETINAFYKYLIDESYDISEDFDYNRARVLYKKLKIHAKMVEILIKEINTSLNLVEFNNVELKGKLEKQLDYYKDVDKKNKIVLSYNIRTKQGYYKFIKDVIYTY